MSAELALLWAGAFLAGFVNGFAGFGTALFALGWWLQIMPPVEAVALSLAAGCLTGVPGLHVIWRRIEPRLLMRFALPAFVGIPLGSAALAFVEARTLMLLTAALLIAYGAFFSVRASLPSIGGDRPRADAAIGFAGGVLGGMAGLSGVLPAIWVSLRDWDKGRARGLLQPFNTLILSTAIVGVAWQGGYTADALRNLALALPAMGAGVAGGIVLYRRVSDAFFRRALIVLLLLSGFALLVQAF